MKSINNNSSTNKVSMEELSRKVKNTDRILCAEDHLLIKDDGIFMRVSDKKAILLLRGLFSDLKLTHDTAAALIKNLKTDPEINVPVDIFTHPQHIRLNNGIWDIQNRRMIKSLNSNIKFCRMVNADLPNNPLEESEILLRFCRNVFDEDKFEEKMAALYEIIGYCISDIQSVKRAVFLIGPANCGKSVILDLIRGTTF